MTRGKLLVVGTPIGNLSDFPLNVAASAAILLARSYALRSWGRTPSSARAAKQR